MTTQRCILNPYLDLWITGLASIVVIALILFINPQAGNIATFGDVLTFTTIINGAHFLASYRMLYQTKEYALRYKNASIYMPALLFTYCFFAIFFGRSQPVLFSALQIVASLYLALHYTGQAWGMVCSLAYIDKVKFEEVERRYFKLSLKLMMFWQVVWSLKVLEPKPEWLRILIEKIYFVQYILMSFAVIFGIYATFHTAKRLNSIKLRMLVPYYAMYLWYGLLSVNYFALPLVQFFHASQYLIFPLRVELNRNQGAENKQRQRIIEYSIIMLLLGAGAFVLIPYYFKNYNQDYFGSVQVIISAINIHHFYIDGYIWKISQPLARDELFAHIK